MNLSFSPVGITHSEHHNAIETLAQPVCYRTVEVFPEFTEGLKDTGLFPSLSDLPPAQCRQTETDRQTIPAGYGT
jgi:hypothetical protein